MVALEAGYDLGGLIGCLMLIGFLTIVGWTFAKMAAALDFSIFGVHPLRGISHSIENTVVRGCEDGIAALQHATVRFFNGLVDSLAIVLGLAILLGEGVKAALTYLWSHALSPFVHAVTDPIAALARRAETAAAGLPGELEHAVARAADYADAAAAREFSRAEAFARDAVSAGVSEAERFAAQAVAQLRAAEDVALAVAAGNIDEAIHAGELAAAAAVSAGEAAAERAIAEAQTATQAALRGIQGLADQALHDLGTIEGALGATGAAALIAAIPALVTLVQTIAVESGLENAECRAKVKGVCGTNPAQWGQLLGSLALMGGLLDFRELVAVVRPLVRPGADLIRQAA